MIHRISWPQTPTECTWLVLRLSVLFSVKLLASLSFLSTEQPEPDKLQQRDPVYKANILHIPSVCLQWIYNNCKNRPTIAQINSPRLHLSEHKMLKRKKNLRWKQITSTQRHMWTSLVSGWLESPCRTTSGTKHTPSWLQPEPLSSNMNRTLREPQRWKHMLEPSELHSPSSCNNVGDRKEKQTRRKAKCVYFCVKCSALRVAVLHSLTDKSHLESINTPRTEAPSTPVSSSATRLLPRPLLTPLLCKKPEGNE